MTTVTNVHAWQQAATNGNNQSTTTTRYNNDDYKNATFPPHVSPIRPQPPEEP
ncbi:hypothetical protein EJ02DRAFT_436019 [Clathrospora elynae]|uniref:Uncharacterized protein n=1 Tax=Clathrospora elynae TaxID=706981 RepID=A0A6A5SIK9_9PLEO|nr:hypothetical protein EJ02DRAFT_436019 [Clathrospora elynae]